MARRTGGFQSEIQRAEDKRTQQFSRNVLAIFLFLLACGIVAILVILNLPQQRGRTFFVYLYVNDPATHPFVMADQKLLQDAVLKLNADHVQWLPAIAVSSDDFLNDIGRLQSSVSSRDHLVLYVAMPGAVRFESGQGVPGLRTQVGEFAATSSNLLAVNKLLDEIQSVPALSRLLIFDPGQTTSGLASALSRYYGVADKNRPAEFISQELTFPYFLAQTIQQSRSTGTTWALIGNRTFESSAMLQSLGHSVLAHAVAKSLGQSQNEIDVLDFYQKISLECRRLTWWNPPAAGNQMAFGQIPVLVDAVHSELLNVRNPQAATTANRVVGWVGSAKETAANADTAATPAAESPPATNSSPMFAEIWQLVFQIESRESDKPHSPIDFAPEAWAKFLEGLVDKHVAYLSTRKLDKNNDDEIVRWRNELTWTLRAMTPTRPVPENEAQPGTIQTSSLRTVSERWANYRDQWNRSRPDESRQVGTTRDLVDKSLQLGRLRDGLFQARFYLQGFDLSPERFPQTTAVVKWMEQVGLERTFADKSLQLDNGISFTAPPEWAVRFATWEATRSHWTFERDVRSFLLAGYLQKNFPEVDPRHDPGPSESDFRTGLAGAIDPQENPQLNARWFDQYTINLLNAGRELGVWTAAGLNLSISELPNQMSQVLEFTIKPWAGIGEEPAEMKWRRLLTVAASQFLGNSEYSAPAIAWREKRRSFAVAVAANPANPQSLKTAQQGYRIEPPAEYSPVIIDLAATLENIPTGSIRWQIVTEPADSLASLVQPADALGQDRRQLVVVPQANREQIPQLQSIVVEARPADDTAPAQQFTFAIQYPPLDEFQVRLANSTWTEQQDIERAALRNFGAALQPEARVLVQPVTGVSTPLAVQVRNITNQEQNMVAKLYAFETNQNGLQPGRIEIGWLSSAELDQLLAARQLRLLHTSAATALAPQSWTTVNWGTEPNPGGPLSGALVLALESPAEESRRPRRVWYSVIELRRIRAGQTVRYAEERGSQPMYFERVNDLAAAAVNEVKTLNMKASRPDLPFTLGKTPGAEEREWNVTLEPPRSSTTGYVFLDLLGEPRALRYSFESTLNAKPLAERSVDFELTQSEGLATGFYTYRAPDTDLPTTVWLINGSWNQEQRDKHQLQLKLDLVEKMLNQPWTLRRSTVDEQGNTSGATTEVRTQVDRREQFGWSTTADRLVITTSASDFQFPLPEGPSNLQYDVGQDDSIWARLRIIKRPPNGELRRPQLAFANTRDDGLLLAEKDRLEINVTPPAADRDTILVGSIRVYWNDEAKPLWEQPIAPENEGRTFTVPKAKVNEKLEKAGEYRVKATFVDFFGRESDPVERTLRITLPPVNPANDPNQPKPVDLTIQIKPSARIQAFTFSGVTITRDTTPTQLMINGKRVTVRQDLASGKVILSGLAPGEYEGWALRQEGFREEKSAVQKLNLKNTMTWTFEFKKEEDEKDKDKDKNQNKDK